MKKKTTTTSCFFFLEDCNSNTGQAQVISTSRISGKNFDGLTSEATKWVTPKTNDFKPVARKEVRTPLEDLNSPKTGPPHLPLRKPVAAATPAVPLARKHCTSSVTTPIDCRSLASMGDTTPQQDNYSVIPEGDISHCHIVLPCKKLKWSHQHFKIQTGVAFFDLLINKLFKSAPCEVTIYFFFLLKFNPWVLHIFLLLKKRIRTKYLSQ